MRSQSVQDSAAPKSFQYPRSLIDLFRGLSDA